MIGQLQDAGNTTTLAHYLELLSSAGMLTGLHKFAGQRIRQRASSPKLQVLNTALLSSQSNLSFNAAQRDREFWGRLVESSAGAHLINSSIGTNIEVFYWRDRGKEVDFILRLNKTLVAIEIKSGYSKGSLPGIEEFDRGFKPKRKLLVGGEGIPIDKFLSVPALRWFE